MQQQQHHQQQQPQIMTMMPPFPPTNITTEQIQKYLDENKKLILAILDNQNLGKLAECAQYQALLQKNLMYLAAIADAQPPAPQTPSQMQAHPGMQQGGGLFMQHPQAAAMAQQQQAFAQKMPMHFSPQQMQDHHQQQQQLHHQQQQQQAALHGHMMMRPGGANNGMQVMHNEATLGGGLNSGGPTPSAGLGEFSRGTGVGGSSNTMDARGGNQQELEGGSKDAQGNSSNGEQ
ncbi:hypothetical protein MKW94_019411 [Papaver nudicaule]|uniref:SS18 N-terminal domain-containing protein n=1 Tax=Papaver nudicaule TaxID=74823 RepID=A0AA41VDC6_PAPNU|nr:hypothetical protein [Papaver nudicaule]